MSRQFSFCSANDKLCTQPCKASGNTAGNEENRVIGKHRARLHEEHGSENLSGIVKNRPEHTRQPEKLLRNDAPEQEHSAQAEFIDTRTDLCYNTKK